MNDRKEESANALSLSRKRLCLMCGEHVNNPCVPWMPRVGS